MIVQDLKEKAVDDDDIQDYVRPWRGLKDEEVYEIYERAKVLLQNSWVGDGDVGFPITLYKIFEAKLRSKNT
jgi:hypothetical protein